MERDHDYPVEYFGARGTRDFPADLLQRELIYYQKGIETDSPILGETGIEGLRLDFNSGLRLQVPEGNWHIRISDGDSQLVMLDKDVSGVELVSLEKYYIRWQIEAALDGRTVFVHVFDAGGQRVHFFFPSSAMGDTVALLPYMQAFREKHHCRISCSAPAYMREIVELFDPTIEQVDTLGDDTYASYYLGAWVNMPFMSPVDGRLMPLTQIGQPILGLGPVPAPRFSVDTPRMISERYVCIAVQASSTGKAWLYPGGWEIVVDYLKSLGYRVLCIDRDRSSTNHGNTVVMPDNAEDCTGNLPMSERANQIAGADFFIGVSSGLAWVAWALGRPVVMISGISFPWYEFPNPYRIINYQVCHGCLNDAQTDFEKCGQCPWLGETPRRYECSKAISPGMVIGAIDRLRRDHHLATAESEE